MKRAWWWLIGLTLGAGLAWLAGLVALGIWNEDACMANGIASGYTQSVRVWPPALTCEYTGRGSVEVVEHTIRGWTIVGWTYGLPLLIGAGLLTWALTASESPKLTWADRTAD